jgi:hypothetical protein
MDTSKMTVRTLPEMVEALKIVAPFHGKVALYYEIVRRTGADPCQPYAIQLAVTEAEMRGYLAGVEFAVSLQDLPKPPEFEAFMQEVMAIQQRYSDEEEDLADSADDEDEDTPEACAGCADFAQCWPASAVVN